MKASILQDFDSRTSAFAEVRALGLKTVLRLATISMLVWLIFSVGVVWLLVTDRKQAFESVVKSHQQDIADGTSRTFIESMDRGDLAGISNVKACWESSEARYLIALRLPRTTRLSSLYRFSYRLTLDQPTLQQSTLIYRSRAPWE